MRKRVLTLLLALLLCAALLAGCGGDKSRPASGGTDSGTVNTGGTGASAAAETGFGPYACPAGFRFLRTEIGDRFTAELDRSGHVLRISSQLFDSETECVFDYQGDRITASHLIGDGTELITGSYQYSSDGLISRIDYQAVPAFYDYIGYEAEDERAYSDSVLFRYNENGLLEEAITPNGSLLSEYCPERIAAWVVSAGYVGFDTETADFWPFDVYSASYEYAQMPDGAMKLSRVTTMDYPGAEREEEYRFSYDSEGRISEFSSDDGEELVRFSYGDDGAAVADIYDGETFELEGSVRYDPVENVLRGEDTNVETIGYTLEYEATKDTVNCRSTEYDGETQKMHQIVFRRLPVEQCHLTGMPWAILIG